VGAHWEPDEIVIGKAPHLLGEAWEGLCDIDQLVVGVSPEDLPVVYVEGSATPLNLALRQLRDGFPGVLHPDPLDPRLGNHPERYRVVAIRKSGQLSGATRLRELEHTVGRGEPVNLSFLERAGYILVLSTLGGADAALRTLDLYRFRFQLARVFSGLEARLPWESLPAGNASLHRIRLYAMLLAALLMEAFMESQISASPWGFPLPRS
jgi:hypothetical protein